MSKFIRDLLAKKTEQQKEEQKKRAAEKARKEEICKRQSVLLGEEVNLEWKIIFGQTMPKKKKDIFVIKDVTRRNVWMEPNFLYNHIKEFKPDDLFHAPEKYALQWQPRGSLYRLVIPLDDPQTQENAIVIMSEFSKLEQQRIVFFFGPIDPSMDMYAPKVHPASLVSYHTKNEVLKKLCDYFLLDRISVQDIQAVLMCDQYVWSATLYNLLPADEQVYHTYLNEQKPLDDTKKTIAKSYIDGEITLTEYEDAKFPDRKKLRNIEDMTYPLPFEMDVCTICTKGNSGIVSCHTCANMVCASCMASIFSGKNGRKSISFLLMHQKFCMKLGELTPLLPVLADEPAYLREFRGTSRAAALDLLLPKKDAELMKEDELSDDEEETAQRKQEEEEAARLAAEEAARLQRDNPKELQALQEQLDSRMRKLERISKDIIAYTDKALDKSHTEHFIARNTRLRAENIEKLDNMVTTPVTALLAQAQALHLTGEYIDQLVAQATAVLAQCTELSGDLSLQTRGSSAAASTTSPSAAVRKISNRPSGASSPTATRPQSRGTA